MIGESPSMIPDLGNIQIYDLNGWYTVCTYIYIYIYHIYIIYISYIYIYHIYIYNCIIIYHCDIHIWSTIAKYMSLTLEIAAVGVRSPVFRFGIACSWAPRLRSTKATLPWNSASSENRIETEVLPSAKWCPSSESLSWCKMVNYGPTPISRTGLW